MWFVNKEGKLERKVVYTITINTQGAFRGDADKFAREIFPYIKRKKTLRERIIQAVLSTKTEVKK